MLQALIWRSRTGSSSVTLTLIPGRKSATLALCSSTITSVNGVIVNVRGPLSSEIVIWLGLTVEISVWCRWACARGLAKAESALIKIAKLTPVANKQTQYLIIKATDIYFLVIAVMRLAWVGLERTRLTVIPGFRSAKLAF